MSIKNDICRAVHDSLCSQCGDVGTGLTIRGADAAKAAGAVMVFVDRIVAERDQALASVEHLKGDLRRQREDMGRDRDAYRDERNATQRELDVAKWLHAEAVWQQERIYIEADRQLVESEESRFRWAEEAAELETLRDEARSALVESERLREIYFADRSRLTVDIEHVAEQGQAWKEAHDRVRASAVVLPEDWREQMVALEQTSYDAARADGVMVAEISRAAYGAGLDAAAELVDSWRDHA